MILTLENNQKNLKKHNLKIWLKFNNFYYKGGNNKRNNINA